LLAGLRAWSPYSDWKPLHLAMEETELDGLV
jgi:hypothetical protein